LNIVALLSESYTLVWIRAMQKGKRYPAEILTASEVQSLIHACTGGTVGLRNRAMLYVLWRCGLRVSELLSLKASDVTADSVRVLHGKGDKARTVGLDPEAAAVLGQWLERRRTLGLRGPVFCTLKGEPLHTNAVRELLKRLCRKAGVERRVTPHTFRHTFAATAARQIPVHYVQSALGHSSLAVTSRYVAHLGGAAVDAVRSLTWN
jgi:integrase/recombinase XerD